MMRRMLRAWQAVGSTFGVWVAPVVTAWLFVNLRLFVALAMAMDPLFFPRLRTTSVRAPVAIVGNPRTGTTFLQRFLVDTGAGAGQQLWRMLYPSLVLQTMVRPFVPWLERVSPARHHTTVAHDTSLLSVEVDDVSVFFRYFDGFFLYGFLLGWHETDFKDDFDPRVRDTSERDFAWLEALWRRSLVWTGRDRVIAKLFSVGTRTPAFLARFPDAKILYLARDPLAVIPSTLSLVTGVLDKRFGYWTLPEDVRKRHTERLYQGLVQILQRFHEDWAAGRIPKDRVRIVRFDRLMSDFEGELADIARFLDWQPTEAQQAEIRRVGEEQRRYKSPHTYDLARFGLDADRIRKDCAFVYDTFLNPSDPS
jgi:omega-hydroxy-beta-dihydromenaquinone-9 sulfotransferase